MCLTEGALQAYVDGEVTGGEREHVLAHLAGCPRCRELADGAAARRERIAGLLPTAPPNRRDVAAVALARFRERLTGGPHPEVGAYRTGRFRKLAADGRGVLAPAALAAAALLAVFLGWRVSVSPRDVGSGLRRIEPSRVAPRRIELPTPVLSAGQPPLGAEPSPREIAKAAVTRPVRSSTESRSPAVGPASDNPYYLLTADATPPELGVVVRVKVPLSVLTGDPGSISGTAEPGVEADVLVGQDGRPRAIRFVNQMQPIGGK